MCATARASSPSSAPSTRADSNADDNCRASCVDWYGNSRPLFIRNRVFALLGYEIVEGRIVGSQIAEVRRISFSPNRVDRVGTMSQ